jgi:hypothetical protein
MTPYGQNMGRNRCGPQKQQPSLSRLLHQTVFVMQAAQFLLLKLLQNAKRVQPTSVVHVSNSRLSEAPAKRRVLLIVVSGMLSVLMQLLFWSEVVDPGDRRTYRG